MTPEETIKAIGAVAYCASDPRNHGGTPTQTIMEMTLALELIRRACDGESWLLEGDDNRLYGSE